jgi:hypothetical protein
MNWTVKKKGNFVNSSQHEGLSFSGIALSFDGFGSISCHSVWFSTDGSFSFHIFFRISNFFDLSISEETWVVEMRIWCIIIVNVLVLNSRICISYRTYKINACSIFYHFIKYVTLKTSLRNWKPTYLPLSG